MDVTYDHRAIVFNMSSEICRRKRENIELLDLAE
jgi:hypothetical protein